MKLIFTLGITLLLSACNLFDSSQSPIPAEFAGADYQLSDKNAKQWAITSKQAEQCIYPNLTRIQQQHFAKEDSYIHSQYVFFYPLENIIGEDYVKIIQNDEKSMNYATYQFKKFRTAIGSVESLNNQYCQILRTQARDDLDVVKGQYKNGMVDNSKNEDGTSKNTDGVATNQNKFFFDIIKWGSALLL
ncbi:DUF5358 domain-containing protein [Rodentibacter pneumotropicus]|uniref:DUF5358 domain-containing protein n=2 Tax=Rodentibacter pneumotropicus TaxID=758 RepID=A0A1V3K6K2_9PAST|nr:DUF5358 domain-containing protein [Rodentibacter pneumotropicus]MCQ9121796.1 DUF5358 domain-containing protein [Rodentibacter pneumotropicus]NBH74326.1 hypothetical protein [Rodentibacter pneumotropicus]OOF61793.1 hypothetical protein BKL50_07590 [Rodentibacter pneumotropicus]OOF63802.1 hypothetical protein BH925_07550 [Rodentibacter pneumotropicus]OOF68682.1 hypothetical protein BKG95_04610 [Rodentibacter pneumotropicus]